MAVVTSFSADLEGVVEVETETVSTGSFSGTEGGVELTDPTAPDAIVLLGLHYLSNGAYLEDFAVPTGFSVAEEKVAEHTSRYYEIIPLSRYRD